MMHIQEHLNAIVPPDDPVSYVTVSLDSLQVRLETNKADIEILVVIANHALGLLRCFAAMLQEKEVCCFFGFFPAVFVKKPIDYGLPGTEAAGEAREEPLLLVGRDHLRLDKRGEEYED
jgi:hypothetical protein